MEIRSRVGTVIFSMALMIASLQLLAQPPVAAASLSKSRIQLGDQFTLTLKLNAALNDRPVVFARFPDSVNHLEVIRQSPVDSVRAGDRMIYTREIIMTGFDSGMWVIPAQAISAAGKRLSTEPVSVTVMSVPLKGSEYNDIKEIITVDDSGIDWKKWLLVLVTITVAGLALRYWWNKRKLRPVVQKVDRATAFDEAMQALKKIRQERETGQIDIKPFFSSIYDVYRNYLSGISREPYMQYTTDDILIGTKDILPPDVFSSTAEVLRISDAVKFAKYPSGPQESAEALERIRQGIEVINRQKQAL